MAWRRISSTIKLGALALASAVRRPGTSLPPYSPLVNYSIVLFCEMLCPSHPFTGLFMANCGGKHALASKRNKPARGQAGGALIERNNACKGVGKCLRENMWNSSLEADDGVKQ